MMAEIIAALLFECRHLPPTEMRQVNVNLDPINILNHIHTEADIILMDTN